METLAIVEILGRRGEVVARERITSLPAVVGRGFDADVLLDDEFVAARHLKIFAGEDGFTVEDMGSMNGFQIIGKRRSAGSIETVAPGTMLRLGRTQIRIWRPDSTVKPELPSPRTNPRSWLVSLGWFVAVLVLVGIQGWLEGSGPAQDGVTSLVALVAVGVIIMWSGVWSLSDRRPHDGVTFITHVGIASMIVVLVMVSGYALQTLAFASGFFDAAYRENGDLSQWAAVSYGVYCHLRLVSRRRRWVQGVIAGLCVGALILSVRYVTTENDKKDIGEMAISSLMRPGWMRVVEGRTPEAFLDQALPAVKTSGGS